MSHFLYRVGNFAGRHPWRIIAAWIFVAGAVFTEGTPDEIRNNAEVRAVYLGEEGHHG